MGQNTFWKSLKGKLGNPTIKTFLEDLPGRVRKIKRREEYLLYEKQREEEQILEYVRVVWSQREQPRVESILSSQEEED